MYKKYKTWHVEESQINFPLLSRFQFKGNPVQFVSPQIMSLPLNLSSLKTPLPPTHTLSDAHTHSHTFDCPMSYFPAQTSKLKFYFQKPFWCFWPTGILFRLTSSHGFPSIRLFHLILTDKKHGGDLFYCFFFFFKKQPWLTNTLNLGLHFSIRNNTFNVYLKFK